MWIDTHAHLDAAEFDPDRSAMRQAAREAGVGHCVIPAVERANWAAVRALAHAQGDSYCLGIHPLYVPQAQESDLTALDAALTQHREDPRLVAVGEIGLDFFVPALCEPAMRERQEFFYAAQLRLARAHGLPVVLHVRRSADRLLKHLRALAQGGYRWSGIAHAFNGSQAQAMAFVGLGFKLGFGGALTYARALQLRRLACDLPLDALVLETDSPDIPPHWLYVNGALRAEGQAQGRNTSAELPRIAAQLAALRGLGLAELQAATYANACAALSRLALV
jgi:TatD DNase family protein